MKNLDEYINESLTASLTLLAATTFFSTITMAVAAASNHSSTSDFDTRSPWQVIKDDISSFFKDKKLKKIAEKYKDDPDVKDFVENPTKKGWRKMLETKLSEEEIQYLNSLTRNYFK